MSFDDYRSIEMQVALKYDAEAKGTRKSIGDFLLHGKQHLPVNVKSNNLDNKNYSPNMMSAKRLIKWWGKASDNEMYFLFIDYRKGADGLDLISDSGLIKAEQLSWNCLTIEAQGWGVIQMYKPREIVANQTREEFLHGMKLAYAKYLGKETAKMAAIREMIKDF